MAVRSFDGAGDSVTCAIGSLADLRDGNLTIAAIIKTSAILDAGIIELWDDIGIRCGLIRGGSNFPIGLQDDAGGAFVVPPPAIPSGIWCVACITRSAGVIRAHIYNFNTTTWAHTDGSAVAAVNDTLTSVRVGGTAYGAEDFNGLMAVGGARAGTALSDVQVETLPVGLQEWVDVFTGNAAVWPLNQATTADPVPDIVGAADQTALSGTTVVTGDDPPGFDFTLAPPEVGIPQGVLRKVPRGARIRR